MMGMGRSRGIRRRKTVRTQGRRNTGDKSWKFPWDRNHIIHFTALGIIDSIRVETVHQPRRIERIGHRESSANVTANVTPEMNRRETHDPQTMCESSKWCKRSSNGNSALRRRSCLSRLGVLITFSCSVHCIKSPRVPTSGTGPFNSPRVVSFRTLTVSP
jgi:hypothetical protein